LPKQLAVPATPGRMRSITQLTAQARNREDRAKHEATVLAERLATLQITLHRLASGEEVEAPAQPAPTDTATEDSTPAPAPIPLAGRLFGSVTSQDLVEALAAQGIALEKKKLLLPEPIKTLGVHRVPVRLHAEVSSELVVAVERKQ
jgi:large subunit ribosomal protein L9